MAQKILDAYRRRGFDCMCGNLRMASRAVTAIYDAHLAPSGLTSNQLAVLWPIVALEPTPMSEIARNVVMDKTTVSRNVASLVDAGLVEVRTGDDGRHRLVSTTARGRHAFAVAMPGWEAAQEEVSRLFGKSRFASLVKETRKLARTVAETAA
ncbi:MAG TPA: MarR family winged helix-turn-helix transcriptional regulator [Usitatibacter sp.]|nr:MarR family winged helix-turn-helix transcriptional regulator [Usitatibacter sp.]